VVAGENRRRLNRLERGVVAERVPGEEWAAARIAPLADGKPSAAGLDQARRHDQEA